MVGGRGTDLAIFDSANPRERPPGGPCVGVTTMALEPRLVRDEPGYHAFAVPIPSVQAVSRTATTQWTRQHSTNNYPSVTGRGLREQLHEEFHRH